MQNVVAKRLLAKEQRESRKSDKTRKDDQKLRKSKELQKYGKWCLRTSNFEFPKAKRTNL